MKFNSAFPGLERQPVQELVQHLDGKGGTRVMEQASLETAWVVKVPYQLMVVLIGASETKFDCNFGENLIQSINMRLGCVAIAIKYKYASASNLRKK